MRTPGLLLASRLHYKLSVKRECYTWDCAEVVGILVLLSSCPKAEKQGDHIKKLYCLHDFAHLTHNKHAFNFFTEVTAHTTSLASDRKLTHA